MFIAHLPAGYLVGRAARRAGAGGTMAAALIGSILPDLDLFYFYLVDGRQHHHHSYWIHYPVVWVGLAGASALWLALTRRQSRRAWQAFILCLSGLVHIALDGVVGDVMLFAPFSHRFYALAHVEALYSPWWLNFLLHWSFAIELAITGAALWLLARECRAARARVR